METAYEHGKAVGGKEAIEIIRKWWHIMCMITDRERKNHIGANYIGWKQISSLRSTPYLLAKMRINLRNRIKQERLPILNKILRED